MEQTNPIQLIADEQRRLAGELREIPVGQWSALSGCEGWSNARVLSHLTWGSRLYQQSVTRALQGDTSPLLGPDGRQTPFEELRQLFTARQEELAQQPPGVILEQFASDGSKLADLFQSLAPGDLQRPAWHPFGILTIGTFVQFRVYELGFHGWDIRASLDPEAPIRPALQPYLLDIVRQAQTRFCHPEPQLEGSYRCHVDGQAWTVRLGSGALEEASEEITADLTVTTDVNTFLLLATARRSLSDLAPRATIEGDRQLAERYLIASCFRI